MCVLYITKSVSCILLLVLCNDVHTNKLSCVMFTAGGVLLFVTRKLDSEQVAANLQIQGYSGE